MLSRIAIALAISLSIVFITIFINYKKIAEKKAEVEAAGIVIPADMDDEAFVKMFGMGSTKARAGKEMEAIRAANFLLNQDEGGAAWIAFNKDPDAAPAGARGRRSGGRRSRG